MHDHFTKGFSLNKQLLETSDEKRDRLSRELRNLRINDQDLYKKLTDAISVTCSDYKSQSTRELTSFFANMQDSFHFAVSGYTAAELVYYNVDSNKPNCGMIANKRGQSKIKSKNGVKPAVDLLSRGVG